MKKRTRKSYKKTNNFFHVIETLLEKRSVIILFLYLESKNLSYCIINPFVAGQMNVHDIAMPLCYEFVFFFFLNFAIPTN